LEAVAGTGEIITLDGFTSCTIDAGFIRPIENLIPDVITGENVVLRLRTRSGAFVEGARISAWPAGDRVFEYLLPHGTMWQVESVEEAVTILAGADDLGPRTVITLQEMSLDALEGY
jgi:hypothetical protein